MSIPTQYFTGVASAHEIVEAVERAVADHAVGPGAALPTVRALADQLGVSPSTVSSAYRTLAGRGIVTGRGRQGTRVSAGPPLPSRPAPPLPSGVRNLADGNPDPALLPRLAPVLRRLDPAPVTYGDAQADVAELCDLARDQLEDEGLPVGRIVVVAGALDGVERVLQAHLRPGDRVAVEDPGFSRTFDLATALGLVLLPVTLDERGMRPESLAAALADGAEAVVITPRAQNPTGAAMDAKRAKELRTLLRDHPEVLVIEDDHAGPIAGAPARSVIDPTRDRWALIRSVAKSLGPDLRLAVLTGDRTTVDRVEGRLRLGTGWVSQLLQRTVVALWSDPRTDQLLDRAEATYASRRAALVDALAEHGIAATGPSGLNVWIPVREEERVIGALLLRGWALAAGERFRVRSGPAVRVCVAALSERDARRLAADLAEVLSPAAGRAATAPA